MKTLLFIIFALLSFNTSIISQNSESEFDRGIIEIGVVVSDLERSLNFYKNVVGMKQVGGFDIDEDFGKRSGLSNGEPFSVAILKLKDDDNSTEWKLMSFGKKANHPASNYIQDDLGMQYITIFVKSVKPFLKRIKEHKVKLLGDTPTELSEGRSFVLIQDPDGTFIELIGKE